MEEGAGKWTSTRMKGDPQSSLALPILRAVAENVHFPRSDPLPWPSGHMWASQCLDFKLVIPEEKWRCSRFLLPPAWGCSGFWSSPICPLPFLTQLVLFFMMIKIYNIKSAISAPITFIMKVRSVRYILQVGAAASELFPSCKP